MTAPTREELHAFGQLLCDTLPDAVKRTMAGQYEQLMATHTGATRYTCFLVGRKVYFPNQVVHDQVLVRGSPPPLARELMPAFHAWELLFKQLYRDLSRISQTVSSVLARAKSWQDARNMFPDHFLRPLLGLPQFAGMQRTALDLYAGPPAAFAPPTQDRLDREAVWDPRLVNMYGQVGGLIDLYLGYKLL